MNTLSKEYIDASVEAAEIGKDKLKEDFSDSMVTKLLKAGFWADITDKKGLVHKLRVKYEGSLTIINFK